MKMTRGIPDRRGFTITELISVLVIVVVLSTISLASFSAYNRLSMVSTTSQMLLRTLAAARSYAVANNGYYQVTLDLDGGAFWIDETDSSGNITVPKVITPNEIDDRVVLDSATIDSSDATSGIARLRFYPNGSSVDAYVYIIRRGANISSGTEYWTIRLYGPTARAVIFQNQHKTD
jgi:prepilin-type N-terminal cleavage/methylation domain-containing protein